MNSHQIDLAPNPPSSTEQIRSLARFPSNPSHLPKIMLETERPPNAAAHAAASTSTNGAATALTESGQKRSETATTPLILPPSLSITTSSGSAPSSPTTVSPASAFIDLIDPIPPSKLKSMLDESPDKTLVIDVRPFTSFAESHVLGAVSICIPSTLLKRPSFGFHHILDFAADQGLDALRRIREYDDIVLYDSSTRSLKLRGGSSTALLRTAAKFMRLSDLTARLSFIVGGMTSIESELDSKYIEDYEDSDEDKPNLPMDREPNSPFNMIPLRTSRQNTPNEMSPLRFSPISSASSLMADDSGGYDLTSPIMAHKGDFPPWAVNFIDSMAKGHDSLSEMFHEIETMEHRRIQGAFSTPSPTSPRSPTMRLGASFSRHLNLPRARTPTLESPLPQYQFCPGDDPSKNRYVNICPYAYNRVKLQNCSPQNDYINASHVSLSVSPLRYIAAQAPVPASFSDFWHCIWDNKVPVIVNLTTLTSPSGVVKSHKYWENGNYGDLELHSVSEEVLEPGITVREFTLQKTPSNPEDPPFTPHHIKQLHYENWPDLGCPSNSLEILKIIDVKSSLLQEWPIDSQVLVHCSAGCGRTGTFITIDSTLFHLSNDWKTAKDDIIDPIFETVKQVREQRLAMVQNVRQLRLCYLVVLDWLDQRATEAQRQVTS